MLPSQFRRLRARPFPSWAAFIISPQSRDTQRHLGVFCIARAFLGGSLPAWAGSPRLKRRDVVQWGLCHLGGSGLGTLGFISVALQASSVWNLRKAVSGFQRVLQTRMEAAGRILGHKICGESLARDGGFSPGAEGVKDGGWSLSSCPAAFPRCPWTEGEHWHLANMTSFFGPRCSFPPLCDLVWWVSNNG